MFTRLASVSIFVLLTGCASQTFYVNGNTQAAPTLEKNQHFFLSGLGQEDTVDAAQVCEGSDNIVKVEARLSFVNGLLGALTRGIYTPRQVRVYCKGDEQSVQHDFEQEKFVEQS